VLHLEAGDQITLSKLMTDNTQFGRPVQSGRWWRPKEIQLHGDHLYWKIDGIEEWTSLSPGLLESFWCLRNASPAEILQFARKHGVLELCEEHGVPASHSHPNCEWMLASTDGSVPWAPGAWACEPLAIWRRFATQAYALAKVASRVLIGQLGLPEDWDDVDFRMADDRVWLSPHAYAEVLSPANSTPVFRGAREDLLLEPEGRAIPIFDAAGNEWDPLTLEKHVIKWRIAWWFRIGNVGPIFTWRNDEKPAIEFGGDGLFGAIALQIALALGQSAGLAICDHCHEFYRPPHRRPKTGQRHFCPTCQDIGIPNRYSLADWREKKRRERNGEKAREQ
jgi:hypothetical protein